MSELLDPILGALAKKLAPLIAAELLQAPGKNPNELMRVSQIASELRTSREIVRGLIRAGTLPQAPDITELRVKRSEVERYGTKEGAK